MEWLALPLSLLALAFVVSAWMGTPIIKITFNKNYNKEK